MKRRLVIRPQADLDLLDHCIFLANYQPQLATRFKQAVRAAFEGVRKRPRSGARIDYPAFVEIELRFQKPRNFKNYLVVYQVRDESVVILRVLHGSQDLRMALGP